MLEYARRYGVPIKVVRIFNTYGPRMDAADGRVISSFIVQALRGEAITVFGDGTQTRSFCYVDDLIDGLVKMAASEPSFTGPVNLGGRAELTVLETASIIKEMTGSILGDQLQGPAAGGPEEAHAGHRPRRVQARLASTSPFRRGGRADYRIFQSIIRCGSQRRAVRFALASLGSRGDVEPCAAIGRELQRRGHEVCMAVPPNFLGFIESAGLAWGRPRPGPSGAEREYRTHYGKTPHPMMAAWEVCSMSPNSCRSWVSRWRRWQMGPTCYWRTQAEQGLAANVAEYYDIPMAALHIFPLEPGGTDWQVAKEAEDTQRRALGLPEETATLDATIAGDPGLRRTLLSRAGSRMGEIDLRRPFVGGLTLELPADADDEVSSWIAAGTPPIYFGFGSSVRLPYAADTLTIISAVCAQLGERALICSGSSDFIERPAFRPRQGGEHGEPLGRLPRLPRGRPPRGPRHHVRRHTGRRSRRWPFPSRSISRCGQMRSPNWKSALGGPSLSRRRKRCSRICARSSLRTASLEPARSPPRWPRPPKALPLPPISWKRRALGHVADRRR